MAIRLAFLLATLVVAFLAPAHAFAQSGTLEASLNSRGMLSTSSSTFAADVVDFDGVVYVDSNYTIPANTTLTIDAAIVPAGGLIKFTDSTSALICNGPITPGRQVIEQRSDRSDRAVVEISGYPVCPTSFGLSSAGNGDGNTDVLNDTIIAASGFGGDARRGVEVIIPAGNWFLDRPLTSDEWVWPGESSSAGSDRDHNIRGHGSKKSVLNLAPNSIADNGNWANSTSYAKGAVVKSATDNLHYIASAAGTSNGTDADLDGDSDSGVTWVRFRGAFNLDDLSNGKISAIGFDGNKANLAGTWPSNTYTKFDGTSATELFPLVRLSSYNFEANNINIRNSKGCGLLVESSQQYHLTQIDAEFAEGWGVVFAGCWNASCAAIGSEANVTGGVLVREQDNDNRDDQLGVHADCLYLENNPVGLRVQGVSGFTHSGAFYHTAGTAIQLGNGARNCVIDHRTNESDVSIEAGASGNTIYENPENSSQVSGAGAPMNSIIAGTPESQSWDYQNGESATSLLSATNLAVLSSGTSATLTNEEVSSQVGQLHPAAFYNGTDLRHKSIAPSSDTWTRAAFTVTSVDPGTYYLYLVTRVRKGTSGKAFVRFREGTGNEYLSMATRTYDTSDGYTYWPISHKQGELTYTKIEFSGPASAANIQFEIGMQFSPNAVLDVFHVDVSSSDNQRIEYRRSSTTIGYGDHVEFADASRPDSDNFDTGVRIWSTDDTAYLYADGANWRTASGSIDP